MHDHRMNATGRCFKRLKVIGILVTTKFEDIDYQAIGTDPLSFVGRDTIEHGPRHCQTNWPGAEEAIIEDSQGAS